MPFKTLYELIAAKHVMGDGITFFQEYPLQFIELVKISNMLAAEYANCEAFSTEIIEGMLRTTYASKVTFFSQMVINSPEGNLEPGEMCKALFRTGAVSEHDTYSIENIQYRHTSNYNGLNLLYRIAYVYNKRVIFWSKYTGVVNNYYLTPQRWDAVHMCLIFGPVEALFQLSENFACLNPLIQKLKTPDILEGEFAFGNLLFRAIFSSSHAESYSLQQKFIELMPVTRVLNELLPIHPQTDDTLKLLIKHYPASQNVLNEVFAKMRLVANKQPAAFKTHFLDKFPYNLLAVMQEKDATLARTFYDISPQNMCDKYPNHIGNYPRPAAPIPAVIENTNENPIPVLSVANFIQQARGALISELPNLTAKYPRSVTQESVAAEMLRQARGLPDTPQSKAVIQLDINLLNNPNSALHYYLRGYVLSRLRTQLIADLQIELLRMTRLDLNPNVGSSSTRVQIIRPVNTDERSEVKKELQRNTMDAL